MKFHVLTLFPELLQDGMNHSIIKRALDEGILSLNCINIRDYSIDKHKRVDDYPYGGGAGMIMQVQPIYDAFQAVRKRTSDNIRVIYLTPQGTVFNQNLACELAQETELILLCGHYEGIDERIIEEIVTDEISIGDYVLTGGELAAMVVMDAVGRLIPGVLGKKESYQSDSFTHNLLEYPQYTRPPVFMEKSIPDVLLSGHHKNIEKWRREQSLLRTAQRRPDLLTVAELSEQDKQFLDRER